MIKITNRDIQIIEFIKEFKVASTTTIARLFFPSLTTAERRLKKLCEAKKLHRNRDDVISEYYYYIKQPTNLKHALVIADVYSQIKMKHHIIKYKREYEIKYRRNIIRVDLMMILKIDNRIVPLLIEIDLCKKYKDKYSEYINSKYYQQMFAVKPEVLVISDRTPESTIQIHWYKLNEVNSKISLK